MKKGAGLPTISPLRLWSLLPQLETSHLPDLLMFAAAVALFYGLLVVGESGSDHLRHRLRFHKVRWRFLVMQVCRCCAYRLRMF